MSIYYRTVNPISSSVTCAFFLIFFIAGQRCNAQHANDNDLLYLSNNNIKVQVNPETFFVAVSDTNGTRYTISAPLQKERVSDLKQDTTHMSWKFSREGINITLELQKQYLDVTINASSTTAFMWPQVQGDADAFTIPFCQGKYIPSRDPLWIKYMAGNGPFSGSQDLSMQFFATNFSKKALLYIIKNMFNNELSFYNNKGSLGLKFNHEFPLTVIDKQYGFRIYLTPNNPAAIAKTYKKYIEETSKIITLEEKAKDNPNIRKLYGAPHIYIWNTEFVTADDIIKWKYFKDNIIKELSSNSTNPTRYIFSLFNAEGVESGKQFLKQLDEFKKEEFVIKYHKNLLAHAFSEALLRKDFYNAAAWKNIALNSEAVSLINKGIDSLNALELDSLNKLLFTAAYPGFTIPVSDWGGTPLSMLNEMQAAGIKKAWLGLSDWISGEMHPEFITQARKDGYLVGTYDSYHSMHQPGKERWLTARFDDTLLYSKAFVLNKNGKPVGGFLGEGRKLNPVLSMPAVEHRMAKVMKNTENEFNSWFIDCDATGEIYDDYTQGRLTNQKEDLEARLKRMTWIRDTYKLVIGSEVGNDFAAAIIAFAHGMTTPIIAWNDPDMRKIKRSPYYIGGYFSNNGGIPDRYSLQIPLKDNYRYIYFDNRFNIPLFQLVYNNVVITSHHWEWNSLKVPAEIKNTELKEILYNVPPLYHLDKDNWDKFKDIIIKQVNVFSKTHEKAIKLEMTGFEWLTKDRLIQRTKFGDSLEIVANFGTVDFTYEDKNIPGESLIIHNLELNQFEIYTP